MGRSEEACHDMTRDEPAFRRLQTALLTLAKHDWLTDASFAASVQRATETVATALEVRRVGVWTFTPDGCTLHCLDLCLMEPGGLRHDTVDPVPAATFPSYFAAIQDDRIVAADDVRLDPRTAELREYLESHHVTSMMDAPIRRGRRVAGVLCHEHVGEPRQWSRDEINFAASAADLIALAMEQWERREEHERRLAAERRLQETQRLESLGRLAGGIAHDFNNLLVAVLGNASLALAQLPRESSARARVAQIEVAARHAAALTQQLLAYSGRRRLVSELIDLNQLVRETDAVLRVSVSKNARIVRHLSAEPPVVEADMSQLRQVVMNLLLNASDALGDRPGEVTITTGLVGPQAEAVEEATLAPAPADRFALLSVADTGSGMSAETRARIFDPFYSTKPSGRGLGLPAVIGIVRAHRGGLRVESEPGEGSCFTILLPAVSKAAVARHERATDGARGAAAEREAEVAAGAGSGAFGGLAIVVDDEAEVRAVTSDIMEHLGFDVVAAGSGEQGLTLLAEHKDRAALMVLDVTMPGLGGVATLRAIRQERQHFPVVLMSGYARSNVPTDLLNDATVFLQKPFTVASLAEAVERVLRPAATAAG